MPGGSSPRGQHCPKVSARPCAPAAVMSTLRRRGPRVIQPSSNSRAVIAAARAPFRCPRRWVQSMHSPAKWRRDRRISVTFRPNDASVLAPAPVTTKRVLALSPRSVRSKDFDVRAVRRAVRRGPARQVVVAGAGLGQRDGLAGLAQGADRQRRLSRQIASRAAATRGGQRVVPVPALLATTIMFPSSSLARWKLAVAALTPASRASSPAASGRSDMSVRSIAARVGSASGRRPGRCPCRWEGPRRRRR